MLGRARFGCWQHSGHGTLDLLGSIARSCNVYFFEMGLATGAESIQQQARALGLGRRSGLPVDYESPGLVPDNTWKRRVQQDSWRDGDTCNMSIGQGALNVTPLQMAMLASVLANQGRLYRPRLVLGTRDAGGQDFAPRPVELVAEMHWRPDSIRVVREGMREVVMAAYGSGRKVRVPGLVMAAKTGSAEYGPRDDRKLHAWMIAFAPYDQPRYAVAMVVDEGISGGETAAPRLQRLFSGLFDKPLPPPPAEGGVG
jgi:penicillin-binding protein 2